MINVQLLTSKIKKIKSLLNEFEVFFKKKIYHLFWRNPKSKEFSIKKLGCGRIVEKECETK